MQKFDNAGTSSFTRNLPVQGYESDWSKFYTGHVRHADVEKMKKNEHKTIIRVSQLLYKGFPMMTPTSSEQK
jgi:hypothetical protein